MNAVTNTKLIWAPYVILLIAACVMLLLLLYIMWVLFAFSSAEQQLVAHRKAVSVCWMRNISALLKGQRPTRYVCNFGHEAVLWRCLSSRKVVQVRVVPGSVCWLCALHCVCAAGQVSPSAQQQPLSGQHVPVSLHCCGSSFQEIHSGAAHPATIKELLLCNCLRVKHIILYLLDLGS